MTGQVVIDSDVEFTGGRNIAMKIPPEQFEKTVEFYARLGLPMEAYGEGSIRVDFGPLRLWLDRTPSLSQAEIWLEINAPDAELARQELRRKGVIFAEGLEALPEDFSGFWIKNPAQIVHLIAEPGQDE